MKRFLIFLLMLALPMTALAAEQPTPADSALVAVLMPEHELVEGIINREGDELRLLMRRADGMLVFVGGAHDPENGWQMTESSPLPENTHLGVENFVESLGIGGDLISVEPHANGTWGVSLFYPKDDGLFRVGPNWLEDDKNQLYIGDHPWSDITRMDWTALPSSFEDALTQLDQTQWVTPNNPDPADRLNLRTQPDKKSASLGKYYNGAPIRLLETQGEWARVDVLGVQGWMMIEFLEPSGSSSKENAFPDLMTKEGGAMLYADPSSKLVKAENVDGDFANMRVIGIVNEEYYHVWFTLDGDGGYIRADELWPGNG